MTCGAFPVALNESGRTRCLQHHAGLEHNPWIRRIAPHDKSWSIAHAGQFAAGVSLLGIALAAGGLSLALNVMHGLETSTAAAVAFGLADGAKIVVPIVCGLIGGTKQMRLTAVICVLASLWAASNAYLDAASRELLMKEHGQTVYADADRQIAELAAEAASLRDLAAKEGARRDCKQNCRALTTQAAEAAQRLEDAREKRAALQPVEASGLAAMVAMAAGANAEKVARGLGAVKAGLFILLVEALVWLCRPWACSPPRRGWVTEVVALKPATGTAVSVAVIPLRLTAKPGTAAYYR
jgi:hypothetical protein